MSAAHQSLTPGQQENAIVERQIPMGEKIIAQLRRSFVTAWSYLKPRLNKVTEAEPSDGGGAGLPQSSGIDPNYDPLETMDVFWEQYRIEAEAADNELVKALGGDLDTLLIFAGLFSAVNTAFIIEAYQDLKPDPAESGGTNDLLRALIQATNSTLAVPPLTFSAPHDAVVSNSLFFASLCFSLFAAFGAVLAKQWLSEYERVGEDRSPHIRGRQRHSKYLALQRYHCEIVIQALGSALQISLFLFFVALAYWLWSINRIVACVVLAGLSIVFVFYAITTAISITDEFSPFSTRVSATIRKLFLAAKNRNLSSSVVCLRWLYDKATSFPAIRAMADAWARLPEDKQTIGHDELSVKLVQAVASSDAITRGFADGTLTSTLRSLQDVNPWRGSLGTRSITSRRMRYRVTLPMLECFELAAWKRDLFMCDSIISALPGPDILSSYPRPLDEKILIELLQSPMTRPIGRSRTAAHLLESPLIGSLSENLDMEPSDSGLDDSWQLKLANALLKYSDSHPSFFRVGVHTIEEPYIQLLLQITNYLGVTSIEENVLLWKGIRERNFSVFRDLVNSLDFAPFVISDSISSRNAGSRLLLHFWLCEQHGCSKERCWPGLEDRIFSIVQAITKHLGLLASVKVPEALFDIGPLLWWHRLEAKYGTCAAANPNFLLQAVLSISSAFLLDTSKGEGLAPWIIPSVTDALSAYASSIRFAAPVLDSRTVHIAGYWFASAAYYVGQFAKQKSSRPEQFFRPTYTALKTALEVSHTTLGENMDQYAKDYWKDFLEADAQSQTLDYSMAHNLPGDLDNPDSSVRRDNPLLSLGETGTEVSRPPLGGIEGTSKRGDADS